VSSYINKITLFSFVIPHPFLGVRFIYFGTKSAFQPWRAESTPDSTTTTTTRRKDGKGNRINSIIINSGNRFNFVWMYAKKMSDFRV
jgi:hypothetical protein